MSAQGQTGFAAGAPTDEKQPDVTQGLSSQDMAAMQAAGVKLEGPEDKLTPTEAAVMRPESMGGVGKGGEARAVQQAVGGASTKAPKSETPQESFSHPPPTEPIPEIANLFSIIAGLGGGGTTLPMMQEGGNIPEGGAAITGEAGPEVVQSQQGGGATVTPLHAAKAAGGRSAGQVIGDVLWGLALGQRGASAVIAGRQQAQQSLATMAIQNPTLLRMSPNAVSAVDGLLGKGTSESLVNAQDPNVQAKAMAGALGIDIVPAGTRLPDGSVAPSESQQLNTKVQQFGWGMSLTSKGEMRFNRPARSPEQQDAIQAQGVFDTVKTNLMNTGVKESVADQAAAKRTLAIATNRGFVPPKWITDMANATTQTDIEAARAGAKAQATQGVELGFAGPKAEAAEGGRRTARFNRPISADEIRASQEIVAQDVGGVVYGREMKDEDLINADAQGFMLKQTPDGSYIGIPRDKIADDALVLSPKEVIARRVANKMATKQTTQTQNAKIVLDALNELDNLDATSLLPEAAPQGKGLGEQVAGAVKTEIKGQTAGRLSVWAARRSPDANMRDKAISLINLNTLATSVVKALGDVGAISEADKSVFYQRLGRIADGTASKTEAQSQMQQLRSLMMAVVSKGDVKPGSVEAAELQNYAHDTLTTSPAPHKPPPGFAPVPGTGAFYSVTPAP